MTWKSMKRWWLIWTLVFWRNHLQINHDGDQDCDDLHVIRTIWFRFWHKRLRSPLSLSSLPSPSSSSSLWWMVLKMIWLVQMRLLRRIKGAIRLPFIRPRCEQLNYKSWSSSSHLVQLSWSSSSHLIKPCCEQFNYNLWPSWSHFNIQLIIRFKITEHHQPVPITSKPVILKVFYFKIICLKASIGI